MEDYKEFKMQIIDTKRSYLYTSSTIRPFNVQEYFPMRIDIAQEVLNNPLFASPPPNDLLAKPRKLKAHLDELIASLKQDFSKQQNKIQDELKMRGIPQDLALGLYLSCFIHQNKHYTPRNVKEEEPFSNLIEYFTKLKYAHCGQKPYALQMLLEIFDIKSRVISYSDIFGWAHGFLQIFLEGKWRILDPTFNVYLDIGIEDIIKEPLCVRKVLNLYSSEFYTDSTDLHKDFIATQIDENFHTTFKYNREWFAFMGFYPFVPPVLTFYETKKGVRKELYDIRKDNRYRFV